MASRTLFPQDLLSTLFERGTHRPKGTDKRSMKALCTALLSERSEIAGTRIAAAILDRYEAATPEDKAAFFRHLADEHDLDPETVAAAANRYGETRGASDLAGLLDSAQPPRQELLRRINRVDGATGRLVRMRADLLTAIRDDASLARVDLDFAHLFRSWFNRGFLVLRRIDWRTPANLLEKIITYEAVHAINDWDDLRRRLEPADRRCFAFFHPAMPDEPLIFVEVALTTTVPGSIRALLAPDRAELPEDQATTAVFYSISNCQRGLAGISFGNFLIKQVATDLSLSLPTLRNFVTLSPVPGLAAWLRPQHETEGPRAALLAAVLAARGEADLRPHQAGLRKLAAEYLLTAKRADGQPLDPVARFHLGNGASLDRIHPLGDPSAKGLTQSCGVMVSYRYDLRSVEANHEAYARQRTVRTTRQIRGLVPAA